jgi:hypothetical protein
MKSIVLAALAGASLSLASTAFASDRIVAQLETPVAEKAKIVAGGSVWTCEGAVCSAAQQTSRATSVRACQSLAKEVGRLSAFGGERRQYEADQLTRCNTAASSQAPAVTQTAAN